jgi:hypothetical protein
VIRGNRAVGAAVNGGPAKVGGVVYGVVQSPVAAQPSYTGATGVFQMGEQQWNALSDNWIAGPITWEGNEANSFCVFGVNSSFDISNRIVGGAGDGTQYVDGYLVPAAILLWSGVALGRPGRVAPVRNAGGTRFYPLRKGIVFYVKATLATALTHGSTVTIRLGKNGAVNAGDDLVINATTPHAKRRYYGLTSLGTNNRFGAVDFLETQVDYSPAPGHHHHGVIRIHVEFYGMYADNDPTLGA